MFISFIRKVFKKLIELVLRNSKFLFMFILQGIEKKNMIEDNTIFFIESKNLQIDKFQMKRNASKKDQLLTNLSHSDESSIWFLFRFTKYSFDYDEKAFIVTLLVSYSERNQDRHTIDMRLDREYKILLMYYQHYRLKK